MAGVVSSSSLSDTPTAIAVAIPPKSNRRPGRESNRPEARAPPSSRPEPLLLTNEFPPPLNPPPLTNPPPPQPQLIISPRDGSGVEVMEVPVDEAILAAGDHQGSTFYQHQGFRRVVLGEQDPEVNLIDGWRAVRMGMSAQQSSESGAAVAFNW